MDLTAPHSTVVRRLRPNYGFIAKLRLRLWSDAKAFMAIARAIEQGIPA
jgi:hypothetical protein